MARGARLASAVMAALALAGNAYAHFHHLMEGFAPRLVLDEERVVLQGVSGALDVGFAELVRGVLEIPVLDVLRGETEKARVWHAEKTVDVRRVAGADLERSINIKIAVRIAINKGIDRDFERVAEPANESSACAGGNAAPSPSS